VHDDVVTFADLDGHMNAPLPPPTSFPGFFNHSYMGSGCTLDGIPVSCQFAEEMAAQGAAEPGENGVLLPETSNGQQDPGTNQGTEQQTSSNGPGFFHRLGHHLSNLFHLHSWNYKGGEGTITGIDFLPQEPVESVTAATDVAGLAATVAKSPGLGYASAAVSIANDRSAPNVITNLIGLIPGMGWPLGIIGAFNDFLDYGIYHRGPDPIIPQGLPTEYHDPPGVVPTGGGPPLNIEDECRLEGDC